MSARCPEWFSLDKEFPMLRPVVGAVLGVLLVAAGLSAFEAVVKIKKIDVEKGVLVLTAPNGRDHTVKVDPNAKFQDEKGKALADGLKAKQLKSGAVVTVTVEPEDNRPVVKAIRLGGRKGGVGQRQPPEKVDMSRVKPLTDMGKGETYKGYQGGLYPEGQNQRPAAHEAAGLALAKKIQPLGKDGKPSAEGKIVLISVGMSNTMQSFNGFLRVARGDDSINPRVQIVNCARGGVTAQAMERESAGYWPYADERLSAVGATPAQVQVVWIKQADAGPSQGFPKYAQKLEAELANIVRILPRRFPNVKLVYLSSRTYGGYAKTRLNPEPYAYESGFSVKWLIEKQIKGDADLKKAPWLSWGPYLWANGASKRADGFSYSADDFGDDGTHQSQSGMEKVGQLLLRFFKTDSTTRGWFVKG
jgi:hypothetical protein